MNKEDIRDAILVAAWRYSDEVLGLLDEDESQQRYPICCACCVGTEVLQETIAIKSEGGRWKLSIVYPTRGTNAHSIVHVHIRLQLPPAALSRISLAIHQSRQGNLGAIGPDDHKAENPSFGLRTSWKV